MNDKQRLAFGAQLKARRKSHGLSQRRLGIRLGVDISMVGHLEAGRRDPSVSLLYRIASVLGGTAGGYLP